MTTASPALDVEHLCRLAGLSRATYYRHLTVTAPDELAHALQDAIQHICLRHKYYGYRRVTASLRRRGHIVNAKKVLRLMREDNLLAQRRTPFLVPPKGKPEPIVIVPNLVRGIVPSGTSRLPTARSCPMSRPAVSSSRRAPWCPSARSSSMRPLRIFR